MQGGEPWWVARDICNVLDIQNTTQAVEKLDDDERAMFNIGRQGEANIISESGLYSLIIRSDKPEAKKFKR
ncbi:MAG: Bro-N domain-containing protein, partial [Synergistaceae bacterium]|nr:Bro-N domain-containing protein [Synergistaceae bacterium]